MNYYQGIKGEKGNYPRIKGHKPFKKGNRNDEDKDKS